MDNFAKEKMVSTGNPPHRKAEQMTTWLMVDSPLTSVPGDEKKFAPDGSNVRVLLRAATHVRVLPVTCDLAGQDIVTS